MRSGDGAADAVPRRPAGPGNDVGPLGRRQFLLVPRRRSGGEPVPAPAGFQTHELEAGLLHAHPDLPVLRARGPQGQDRVLLGLATHLLGGRVVDDLASTATEDLPGITHDWSGRWVLVDADELHLDACGMLCVFVQDGLVASSPALLPGLELVDHRLRSEHILPFYPGPGTGVPGLVRVLPSQRLSLTTGEVRSRSLPRPQVVGDAEAPALLDRVGELLLESVRGAADLGRVVLPLTAGYDSRLVLAACVRLGVEPLLITQDYPGIARADVELPQEMARRLGQTHELVRRGSRDRRRAELYDRQVGGLLTEADRGFLEHDQFRWVRPGDVLLRGIIFDDTRGGVQERMAGVELDSGQIGRAFSADPAQRAALAEWVDWVRRDPQPVSLHDRFCFEQRNTCYAALAELALDLTGVHSMVPGNSGAYLQAALSLPLDWRMASRHHTELVRRWAPPIADLPYNPPRRGLDKARRIGGAARRRARGALSRIGR